jgi:hypothetical protein
MTEFLAQQVPESVVGASDVLQLVLVIVVSMFAIVLAYHAMQRPRLVLVETPEGEWRASRRDIVRYALSMPILLLLWAGGLELILLLTNNGLTGQQITAVSLAIVISVRIWAHISREHAHELAKSIPLTIVTLLIVTSTGWRSPDQLEETFEQWFTTRLTGPAIGLLVVTEFVICAVWYWVGTRWLHPRGRHVPGLSEPVRPTTATG